MSGLNIRRGIFRVWVALTVAWLIVVGFFAFQVYNEIQRANAGAGKFEEALVSVSSRLENGEEGIMEAIPEIKKRRDKYLSQATGARERLSNLGIAAFVLPITLGLLISLLYWVISGFRQSVVTTGRKS